MYWYCHLWGQLVLISLRMWWYSAESVVPLQTVTRDSFDLINVNVCCFDCSSSTCCLQKPFCLLVRVSPRTHSFIILKLFNMFMESVFHRHSLWVGQIEFIPTFSLCRRLQSIISDATKQKMCWSILYMSLYLIECTIQWLVIKEAGEITEMIIS